MNQGDNSGPETLQGVWIYRLKSTNGLWCDLADGIDPARWADLARRLGGLSPDQFKNAEKRLFPDPDNLKSRLKRLFTFDQADYADLPLVCLGPLDTGI